MTTFRVYKESGNFVTVNKHFINDESLSWKAKGILLYLLSRPDDWQVFEAELNKHASDGRDSLRTGIRELEAKQYINRTRKRNKKGEYIEYEYQVFEYPNQVGNSHLGNPQVEKSHLGKSNNTNNDLTNNNLTNNNSRVDHGSYKEIIEYLNSKTGKKFSHKARANQKLIKARMNEGYTKDDFKKVIDNKVNEWKDVDKMKDYLQPSTLFRESNFDKYLNQQPVVKKDEDIISQLLKEG